MEYKWDRCKPNGISDTKWMREQVTRFVSRNPGAKPRIVLAWINSHTPNPWPLCNTSRLGKLMKRILLKSESGCVPVEGHCDDVLVPCHIEQVLVLSHGIARTDLDPIL